jgi:D-2-hydroxyacid dehydrogenase (NADP+)
MTNVLVLETYADDYASALREAFADLEIQVARSPTDEHVDYGRVEILIAFGMGITEPLFTAMPKLKWVQSLATGVDHFLRSKTLATDVLLTSGRGLHGAAMRETVLHLMLSISRDSVGLVHNMADRCWERRPWPLLSGKTAVVIGTGVAGSAIGTLLRTLGMRVVGVSRTPRQAEGFDRIVVQSELVEAASHADYLINVLPGDAANHNLIGRAVFAAMMPHSYFINVGRGETVDEPALIAALSERRIAGAGLDVFASEPLPARSPLWNLPNVFITPHVGGLFWEYQQLAMPLILHNMRAFLDDRKQEMTNVVDRSHPKSSEAMT